MTRIQFGWALPSGPNHDIPPESFVTDIQRGMKLIEGHFDSVWFPDHLQFDNTAIVEGWTALTYFAGLQPQLKLGHLVLCQSFRNPALLAKMSGTFQFLSGGRFILGIGAGWKEDEYKAYGYNFPPAGRRLKELDETLQIINAMWRNEQTTFQGTYYNVTDAWCQPKPDPIPPIMIGGHKPHILRLIARYADWWNVAFVGIEDYRKLVIECERACLETHRNPATLRRTWFGGCFCAPTEAKVKALNKDGTDTGSAFFGTPEQVIEQMRPFIDLGIDYFIFGIGGYPKLTTLEMLTREVLPAVNK